MKKKFIVVGIIFIAFITSIILYSHFIGTKGLVVHEYMISQKLIPKAYNGFKIVHFSDLHYNSTISNKDLEKLVDKINEYKPEIVVFTGDLINNDTNNEDLINALNNIKASLDKFYVTSDNDDELTTSIFNKTDFTNLDDLNKLIYFDSYIPLSFNGYKSLMPEHNSEYYNITLTHNPNNIDNINSNLILAGKTHQGQVILPFIGGIIREEKSAYYKERYFEVNDSLLYISSGLGTNKYQFRLFNKPSINVYRLEHKN